MKSQIEVITVFLYRIRKMENSAIYEHVSKAYPILDVRFVINKNTSTTPICHGQIPAQKIRVYSVPGAFFATHISNVQNVFLSF